MSYLVKYNESGKYFIPKENPIDEELKTLEKLLTNFSQSHKVAQGLAAEIENGLKKGKLPLYVVEKFSRWCDADAGHVKGRLPASRLSTFLFGFILPRLFEKNSGKVSDYNKQLDRIIKNVNSTLSNVG